ncbi:hypothetical protein MMPV_008521 [Pyropia vietnamensis]
MVVAGAASPPLTRWPCRCVPSRRFRGRVSGTDRIGGGNGSGSGALFPLGGGLAAVRAPRQAAALPPPPTARLGGGIGGDEAVETAAADGPPRSVPPPARRVVAVASERGGRAADVPAAAVLEVDVDGMLLGKAAVDGVGTGLTSPGVGGGGGESGDMAAERTRPPPSLPGAVTDRRRALAGNLLVRAVGSVLLPTGYPDSVTPDYLRFAVWNTARQAIRATLDVLGTSSMLAALGVGTPAAAGGAQALSAAANWVLKDGLGSATKIALASRLAPRVDGSAKRWRVVGDVVMSAGTFFELATAVYPAAFLPLASMAVVLKKGADVATGPSYRVVLTSVAAKNNIGDVSARAETQLVVGNLIGLASGLGLVAFLNSLAGGAHDEVLAAAYLGLVASRVGCTYQSMAGVQLRTLNWDRLMWLLEGAAASVSLGTEGLKEEGSGGEGRGGDFASGDDADAVAVGSRLLVPTPADVAEREAFLTGALPPAAARLTIGTHPLGAPVAAAVFPPGQAHGVAVGVTAADDAGPAVHVWLRDGATPLDVVRALWMARLVVAALPPRGRGGVPLPATAAAAAAAATGSNGAAASSAAAVALSTAAATADATWPALVAGLEGGRWDLGRLLFATGPVRYVE